MSAIPEDNRPPRVGLGMLKRFALGAVLIMVLSGATVASAVLLEVNQLTTIITKESKPIPGIKGALDNVNPGGPQTILVLGSDRRFIDIKEKNPTRSDTIMLVRLDPGKGATAVMSIPRDLKVTIQTRQGPVTDKINAAYALGGPRLSVQTVRALLHVPINHVVNVNFGGFQRAVNRLGCVYVDVDRRYYHSNLGLAPSQQYAEINISPGYQKLCGKQSLDYVRYRHTDSDFVRAARQQDFLRQAKDQIGLGAIFGDRKELLRIFGRYTQTDIASDNTQAILKLLKLAFESSRNPISEVHFRGDAGPTYVTVTPQNLQLSRDEFLNVRSSNGPRKTGQASQKVSKKVSKKPSKRTRKQSTSATAGLPPSMVDARTEGENLIAKASMHLGFPLYYPRARLGVGSYPASTAISPNPRVYDISDRGRHRYRAYRIVGYAGQDGQYYGIQGTTWKSPPILDNPTDEIHMRGRTYEEFYDGSRLRLIAWRTPNAVYWVSNSLSELLSNPEMRALARSLSRLGDK
jgi:polyisoprenyl-teichoic acid--peptidoglycan teichoic acid transferase